MPTSRRPSDAKLQRWIDLLALLLTHHYGLTLEEIKQRVPGYAAAMGTGTDDASVSRTFERDKDDLRALGVPIDTRILADGEEVRYRIDPREMYLPYLSLAAAGAKRRVPKEGYRAIPALVLEPEELDAVLRGAQLAANVGDPLLKAQAESAVRKLTFDLPIGSALEHEAGGQAALVGHDSAHGAHLRELGSALLRLKRVSFTYRAIGSDSTATRTVEPYGLFFQSGHWYLAGRDVVKDGVRNFRVSRMSGVKANSSRMQSIDYEIPREFRLAEHARSRQAWELGDGDGEEMVLEFLGKSGAVRAAAALGDPVRGASRQRKFCVRRLDVFARWVLSFAGEVVPVSPPELGRRYRELAAETLALYRRPGPATRDSSVIPSETTRIAIPSEARDLLFTKPDEEQIPRRSAPRDDREGRSAPQIDREGRSAPADTIPPGSREKPTRAMSKDAAARLQRLLAVIPLFADRSEVSREEVERRTGVDMETLLEDLEAVTMREDEPAGFTSSVEATVEPDRLSIRTNQFLRPMRLNVPELCALELGLAMLAASSPADEQRVITRARERVRAVIGHMPAGKDEEGLWHAVAPTGSDSEHLTSLREALRERRKARIAYRSGREEEARQRVVHVYGLIPLNGTWYIAAHDETGGGVRFFRLDRVEGVTVLSETYEMPEKLSLEALMTNGKPFHAAQAETLTVRYSPRVARWIAEREKVPLPPDGSLTLEHPLADVDWAVRHVLQYGPDAEVLAPESVRAAIRERLQRILGA